MDRRFGSRCGRRGRPGPLSFTRIYSAQPALRSAFHGPISISNLPRHSFELPSSNLCRNVFREGVFFRLRGANVEGRRGNVFLSSCCRDATSNPFAGLTEMGRRPLSVDSQEIRRSENLLHLMRLREPTNKRALFFSGRLPLCRPAWTFTPPTPLHVSPSPRRRQHQRIMPCSMLPPSFLPSKMLSCRSISIVGRRKYNTTDELRPRMAAQRRPRASQPIQPSDRAPSERCSSERGRR